jgi:hypothetical protein
MFEAKNEGGEFVHRLFWLMAVMKYNFVKLYISLKICTKLKPIVPYP